MNSNEEITTEVARRLGQVLLDQVDFGSYLKLIRLANGMSRLELAAKARTSRSHLSMLERGLRYPSPKMLKKLLAVFGLQGEQRNKFLLLAAESQVEIPCSSKQPRRVKADLPPLSDEEKEVFGPLVRQLEAQGLHLADR